jgi:GABA(A) receptor-associated protein
MGQFIFVIRKRLKLQPEQALFVYVNEKNIPPVSATLSEIYQQHKDEDGFL